MIQNKRRTINSWQSMRNNARGHSFENYIKAACEYYKHIGLAEVDQTPEPFRTTSTNRDGSFTGRFTAHAQPDFKGTLAGGRAIVFEAKYTSTEKMKQSVLSEAQKQSLSNHYAMGAVVGVCVGIQETFAFIPWEVWKDMKARYGRMYLTVEDMKEYQIKFNGNALFLNYINKNNSELYYWEQSIKR